MCTFCYWKSSRKPANGESKTCGQRPSIQSLMWSRNVAIAPKARLFPKAGMLSLLKARTLGQVKDESRQDYFFLGRNVLPRCKLDSFQCWLTCGKNTIFEKLLAISSERGSCSVTPADWDQDINRCAARRCEYLYKMSRPLTEMTVLRNVDTGFFGGRMSV